MQCTFVVTLVVAFSTQGVLGRLAFPGADAHIPKLGNAFNWYVGAPKYEPDDRFSPRQNLGQMRSSIYKESSGNNQDVQQNANVFAAPDSIDVTKSEGRIPTGQGSSFALTLQNKNIQHARHFTDQLQQRSGFVDATAGRNMEHQNLQPLSAIQNQHLVPGTEQIPSYIPQANIITPSQFSDIRNFENRHVPVTTINGSQKKKGFISNVWGKLRKVINVIDDVINPQTETEQAVQRSPSSTSTGQASQARTRSTQSIIGSNLNRVNPVAQGFTQMKTREPDIIHFTSNHDAVDTKGKPQFTDLLKVIKRNQQLDININHHRVKRSKPTEKSDWLIVNEPATETNQEQLDVNHPTEKELNINNKRKKQHFGDRFRQNRFIEFINVPKRRTTDREPIQQRAGRAHTRHRRPKDGTTRNNKPLESELHMRRLIGAQEQNSKMKMGANRPILRGLNRNHQRQFQQNGRVLKHENQRKPRPTRTEYKQNRSKGNIERNQVFTSQFKQPRRKSLMGPLRLHKHTELENGDQSLNRPIIGEPDENDLHKNKPRQRELNGASVRENRPSDKNINHNFQRFNERTSSVQRAQRLTGRQSVDTYKSTGLFRENKLTDEELNHRRQRLNQKNEENSNWHWLTANKQSGVQPSEGRFSVFQKEGSDLIHLRWLKGHEAANGQLNQVATGEKPTEKGIRKLSPKNEPKVITQQGFFVQRSKQSDRQSGHGREHLRMKGNELTERQQIQGRPPQKQPMKNRQMSWENQFTDRKQRRGSRRRNQQTDLGTKMFPFSGGRPGDKIRENQSQNRVPNGAVSRKQKEIVKHLNSLTRNNTGDGDADQNRLRGNQLSNKALTQDRFSENRGKNGNINQTLRVKQPSTNRYRNKGQTRGNHPNVWDANTVTLTKNQHRDDSNQSNLREKQKKNRDLDKGISGGKQPTSENDNQTRVRENRPKDTGNDDNQVLSRGNQPTDRDASQGRFRQNQLKDKNASHRPLSGNQSTDRNANQGRFGGSRPINKTDNDSRPERKQRANIFRNQGRLRGNQQTDRDKDGSLGRLLGRLTGHEPTDRNNQGRSGRKQPTDRNNSHDQRLRGKRPRDRDSDDNQTLLRENQRTNSSVSHDQLRKNQQKDKNASQRRLGENPQTDRNVNHGRLGENQPIDNNINQGPFRGQQPIDKDANQDRFRGNQPNDGDDNQGRSGRKQPTDRNKNNGRLRENQPTKRDKDDNHGPFRGNQLVNRNDNQGSGRKQPTNQNDNPGRFRGKQQTVRNDRQNLLKGNHPIDNKDDRQGRSGRNHPADSNDKHGHLRGIQPINRAKDDNQGRFGRKQPSDTDENHGRFIGTQAKGQQANPEEDEPRLSTNHRLKNQKKAIERNPSLSSQITAPTNTEPDRLFVNSGTSSLGLSENQLTVVELKPDSSLDKKVTNTEVNLEHLINSSNQDMTPDTSGATKLVHPEHNADNREESKSREGNIDEEIPVDHILPTGINNVADLFGNEQIDWEAVLQSIFEFRPRGHEL